MTSVITYITHDSSIRLEIDLSTMRASWTLNGELTNPVIPYPAYILTPFGLYIFGDGLVCKSEQEAEAEAKRREVLQ